MSERIIHVEKVMEKESSSGKPMLSILLANEAGWLTCMKKGFGGKDNPAYKVLLSGPGAYSIQGDENFIRAAKAVDAAEADDDGTPAHPRDEVVEKFFAKKATYGKDEGQKVGNCLTNGVTLATEYAKLLNVESHIPSQEEMLGYALYFASGLYFGTIDGFKKEEAVKEEASV